ncbi:MAG: hypothetical protein IJZ73_03580 [Clostridia bacterium]|nr:hypothetical protein [Clostridia bacterium]
MKKVLSIVCVLVLCMSICTIGCGAKQQYGSFYDIETAYESGLISQEDVASIAELQNNKIYSTPTNDVVEELQKSYVKRYPRENVSYKDVVIKEFLGSFSDCYAVIIAYSDESAAEEIGTEVVAGIEINYNNGFRISIYQKA